ncbi:MAG: translation initiation factor IF-2 [Waddliaceae bacterium]|nr:translation initiation factor IF-2 [Waddliaceae bacterium]
MAKNLKLNIKNAQLAEALNLGTLKKKLKKKKDESQPDAKEKKSKPANKKAKETKVTAKDAGVTEQQNGEAEATAPRVKARSRSYFDGEGEEQQISKESSVEESSEVEDKAEEAKSTPVSEPTAEEREAEKILKAKRLLEGGPADTEEVARIQAERQMKPQKAPVVEEPETKIEVKEVEAKVVEQAKETPKEVSKEAPLPKKEKPAPAQANFPKTAPVAKKKPVVKKEMPPAPQQKEASKQGAANATPGRTPEKRKNRSNLFGDKRPSRPAHIERLIKPKVKLGPTGRHVNDLLKKPTAEPKKKEEFGQGENKKSSAASDSRPKRPAPHANAGDNETGRAGGRPGSGKGGGGNGNGNKKEYRDLRPGKAAPYSRTGRGQRGGMDEDGQVRWRKKRNSSKKVDTELTTVRPTELTIRLPILLKTLANEMKLKSSQLITKLFMQGVIVTLNDALDDETTIQLLGQEFGCEITIDTSEEERRQVTDKTIQEEIAEVDPDQLILRAPVVAFMGHVDHGKTSLIDAIRSSELAAGEAGAITQHIGAFSCSTDVGPLTVLDTPGHEAFSAMRARGAEVTDIVVLVVAGDEGMRQQTIEAIQHAKSAGVILLVAINKCDKPGFDADTVYRQLAEQDLLPEAWGGQTITVNCSAHTKEGVKDLLEMLALQAEVLELRAHANSRARGRVIEAEMHKGLGAVATVLIQNGSLRKGDAMVFDEHWGYVKTMHNEHNHALEVAGPSTAVRITGLSGIPSAGSEFIVVADEKEAQAIAEMRQQELREKRQMTKKPISLESMLQQSSEDEKKTLKVVLRADVQGSAEALKTALLKIESDKVNLEVIFCGVGEVSEADITLAAASKAIVLGFRTEVERHAESLVKQLGVRVITHDIIYHAVDHITEMMTELLDRIAEEHDRGSAEVRAVFKSSHLGKIAGCIISDGTIHRNHSIRIVRDGEVIWTGPIQSIKRHKDDVREVSKGLECGIVFDNNNIQEGDILQAYEIVYKEQKL